MLSKEDIRRICDGMNGTKVYSPIGWMASCLPGISSAGMDLHGILWCGNCYAFSHRQPARYWADLQGVLRAMANGKVERTWSARI